MTEISERIRKGLKSSLIGIIINGILAVVKGLAGYIGNSYALIADAIESLTDVFTSIIVWNGLRISVKPPDRDHPFGHGKAEPLAALFVSLGILTASVVITVQSIQRIFTPHEGPEIFTIWVLVLVIVTKELLFRHVIKIGRSIESTAVQTDAWHHRSDALTSVAAFIGILFAILGGPGYESADDWAALVAAGVIAYNGYRLFIPAMNELMDKAPDESLRKSVMKAALLPQEALALDKVFVRKMGLQYYVDIHVIVDGSLSVTRGHEIAHEVKDSILSPIKSVQDVIVHIEPYEKREGDQTQSVSPSTTP